MLNTDYGHGVIEARKASIIDVTARDKHGSFPVISSSREIECHFLKRTRRRRRPVVIRKSETFVVNSEWKDVLNGHQSPFEVVRERRISIRRYHEAKLKIGHELFIWTPNE
jgi:hypothetical protein